MMKTNGLTDFKCYPTINTSAELNNFHKTGFVYIMASVLGVEGSVISHKIGDTRMIVQQFFAYNGSTRKVRIYNWSKDEWTEWSDF